MFESLIDVNEEEGSQNTINQHLITKIRYRICIHNARLQHELFFCIVPKTRGSERYRPMNEICDEIKSLRDRGVEITLLGQIVNAYGRGVFPRVNGKSAFVQLLEKIHKIEGIERIRFTSPHPTSFGKDLVEAFSTLPKLGDYAHLPMQTVLTRFLNLRIDHTVGSDF